MLELKCDSLWALCRSCVPATTTPWRWPNCSASANELESIIQVTMWHFTGFTPSFTPRVGWTWKWHNQRTRLPSCNKLSGGYSLGVNKPWGFGMRQNNRQPLWNTNWRERTFYSNNVFAVFCFFSVSLFSIDHYFSIFPGLLELSSWTVRLTKKNKQKEKCCLYICVGEVRDWFIFFISSLACSYMLYLTNTGSFFSGK